MTAAKKRKIWHLKRKSVKRAFKVYTLRPKRKSKQVCAHTHTHTHTHTEPLQRFCNEKDILHSKQLEAVEMMTTLWIFNPWCSSHIECHNTLCHHNPNSLRKRERYLDYILGWEFVSILSKNMCYNITVTPINLEETSFPVKTEILSSSLWDS